MQIRTDVLLSNASSAGCVRENNEDYFLYCEPEDDREFERRGRLLVIADGMGGHRGGEVASRLASEVIRDSFLSAAETDPREVLVCGFKNAHQAILEQARQDVSLLGMGTTCCAAILRNRQLTIGHVGDSRIYLIRQGTVTQLTEDHSLVMEMVKEGLLTPDAAREHNQRNILTQALGVETGELKGDFPPAPMEMFSGDVIVLCTDGLHNLIEPQELVGVLQDQTLTAACAELVASAIARGGPDNITLQMLQIL